MLYLDEKRERRAAHLQVVQHAESRLRSLNERLGKGVGAAKERERLKRRISEHSISVEELSRSEVLTVSTETDSE